MIKKETVEIDGVLFQRTYSDEGHLIERDGVHYSEAIDPIDINREYTEVEAEEETLSFDEIMDRLNDTGAIMKKELWVAPSEEASVASIEEEGEA